jgi:hypothetical protein
MKPWIGSFAVAVVCALGGCQAVSGLNDLRFVKDGGTASESSAVTENAGSQASCGSAPECSDRAACMSAQALGCLDKCDFASEEGCKNGARCAHIEELGGDYCVTPAATCATDSRCDEPDWGTRLCAAGSDAADCACTPKIAGATCDLIAQCGCRQGTHCALLAVRDTQPSVGCTPDMQPLRSPGSACNAEAECPAGYSCWRGLCEKYCTQDGDCAGGKCIALRNPNEVAGVRVCSVTCDFDKDSGCDSSTRCARAPTGEAYCLVPRNPCPFVNDGVCDEPKGTRICAAGTDEADCK